MEARLQATSRDTRGKGAARRMRREGRMPAVLYGGTKPGEAPTGQPIAVDPKALMRILHSSAGVNALIGLTVDGGELTRVMVKDFLLDPVTHDPLHADFYRIAMDKVIRVTVPVLPRGEPVGVKQQGGLLDFVHREIEVECLPADIPEHAEVDVSELVIGQAVRVKDLTPSAKWRPVTEPETMLLHVVPPKAEEPTPAEAAAAVATPAAPAEPEVIKRGRPEKAEDKD